MGREEKGSGGMKGGERKRYEGRGGQWKGKGIILHTNLALVQKRLLYKDLEGLYFFLGGGHSKKYSVITAGSALRNFPI